MGELVIDISDVTLKSNTSLHLSQLKLNLFGPKLLLDLNETHFIGSLSRQFQLHMACGNLSDPHPLALFHHSVIRLSFLNLPVSLRDGFADKRFGDAHCNDLDAWSPFLKVCLKGPLNQLIELPEPVNEYFL